MTDESARACVEAAIRTFGEIMRCLHHLQGPEWADLDLSMAQFKTLMLVASSGGLTGRDLAHQLHIGPSAVTPIVDKLVQHGYVVREEDAADRRVIWTRPTVAGAALFECVNAARRDALEDLLALLPREDLALVERALHILHQAAMKRVAEMGKKGFETL